MIKFFSFKICVSEIRILISTYEFIVIIFKNIVIINFKLLLSRAKFLPIKIIVVININIIAFFLRDHDNLYFQELSLGVWKSKV